MTFNLSKCKIKLRVLSGGDGLKDYYHLTEDDKRRIEEGINHKGRSETLVKREDGKLAVILVEKKKIS